ncbi:hypothetical protein AVEN_20858-1 [Araneus ventricosus]|uniref:PiggyBac transposable element-derived protein domain-containing protein n=1 Tax=Araneus ventricosus TaxID=182803 RepID=A0A4Y2U486_ARAVE|nr:hypothetical protein AVEN_20858-1 [Araneus ventricosus]
MVSVSDNEIKSMVLDVPVEIDEKERERLRKLFAELETDEDSDFDNKGNRPDDILEEKFSNHESFSEYDTESEEDGDSGHGEVNNSEWFASKLAYKEEKQNLGTIIRIRCRNIVSCFSGTKVPVKDVTSPVKGWELFINDNMIHLIVGCTNIFIKKSAPNFSSERDARKMDPLEIRAL